MGLQSDLHGRGAKWFCFYILLIVMLLMTRIITLTGFTKDSHATLNFHGIEGFGLGTEYMTAICLRWYWFKLFITITEFVIQYWVFMEEIHICSFPGAICCYFVQQCALCYRSFFRTCLYQGYYITK